MNLNIWFYVLISLMFSCGSSKKGRIVTVKQDAKVIFDSGEEKVVKANEGFEFEEKRSMLIQSPGHISVLVVPVRGKKQNVDVSLKRFDKSAFNISLNKIYNNELTTILSKIHNIQKNIQEQKTSEALTLVDALREQYPGLTYLSFLKASIHYILGEKEKAKQLLELALEEYPKNEDALSLYSSLLSDGEKNKFLGGGQ